MKVLVTGATGFVGREIVRQLRAAGHTIRILARNPRSPAAQEAVSRWEVEVYPGDVLEAASLEVALAGVDAVIHLVGIISELGNSTFENVHVGGTRNLVAAAQQAGVRRFVHMSALGSRPKAASRYHQSKWAAEELVGRADWSSRFSGPRSSTDPRISSSTCSRGSSASLRLCRCSAIPAQDSSLCPSRLSLPLSQDRSVNRSPSARLMTCAARRP